MKCDNLVGLLIARANSSRRPAVLHKVQGRWNEVGWKEILGQVHDLSEALVSMGIRPGDRVAIYAHTSLRWIIADLAVSAAQAVCVPIYASSTSEECRYILNHSQARFVFVDDDSPERAQQGRLTRLQLAATDCSTLEKIICFSAVDSPKDFLCFEDLLALGKQARQKNSDGFERRQSALSKGDLAHIIYTSGTTGAPKGVMLTHGNWCLQAHSLKSFDVMRPDDSVMLFLPLAHSFAQVTKAVWLTEGFTLQLAESVDKLLENLAEAQPTLMPAVPRVFEKIYSNVRATAVGASGVSGVMGRWAFEQFDAFVEAQIKGTFFGGVGWLWARKLVFSKIQKRLLKKMGGRLRLFVSGGAPLSKKIAYFFELLGIAVLEGYGLTETSALTTVNVPGRIKIGTVGQAVPGTEVQIAQDGEILVRGPGVMQGYYQIPEESAEVLSSDGWLRTGDIGVLDAEGYLTITDRKKDLIVTAGGKNISPQNIESLLKVHPLISQALVYGDKRNYLTALLCVNEDVARAMVEQAGHQVSSYAELLQHPIILSNVQQAVDDVNSRQPSFSTLKKFRLTPYEFSQTTGELTPTLKVKRKFCNEKYESLLNSMYEEIIE